MGWTRTRPRKPAAFDLSGPLDTVPTGYLYNTVRFDARDAVTQRCAEELIRRGISVPQVVRRTDVQCSFCSRLALRHFGRVYGCREHHYLIEALRKTGSAKLSQQGALKDRTFDERDRALRRADKLHRAKGKDTAPSRKG